MFVEFVDQEMVDVVSVEICVVLADIIYLDGFWVLS